jgi:hypothetical protein
MEFSRDYVAAWLPQPKMVLGKPLPVNKPEKPPELLFLKPNPLIGAIITRVYLIEYFFLDFLAYLRLKTQKT